MRGRHSATVIDFHRCAPVAPPSHRDTARTLTTLSAAWNGEHPPHMVPSPKRTPSPPQVANLRISGNGPTVRPCGSHPVGSLMNTSTRVGLRSQQHRPSAPVSSPIFAASAPSRVSVSETQRRLYQPQPPEAVAQGQKYTSIERSTRSTGRPIQSKERSNPSTERSRQHAASASHRQPIEQTLRVPNPTKGYLKRARAGMNRLPEAQQLLVILDLNGTLLYRKNTKAAFVRRPGVDKFLDYLFTHHKVMVWSSARPENVTAICKQLLSEQQHADLVAIWARDTLRLTPRQYQRRTQVYKQLSWVWADSSLHAHDPNGRHRPQFRQANTVLIDDSIEKARSEPYNLLRIEEFEGRPDQLNPDVLTQVVEYLEWLKMHADVSTCLYAQPWAFNPAPTAMQSVEQNPNPKT